MNPSAIYSKSGKGVQEAAGKTSLLKRGDRAVLSAIDGRATLGEVAQKVGKSFDAAFEQLIRQLDKDGFVREVAAAPASLGSATTGSRPAVARPAAPSAPAARAPAAKAPPAPSGGGEDLDFTSIMPAMKPGQSAPPPAADKVAAQRAKEQEAALHKARQEAEARAQAERERMRAELEAKARAEAEARIRAETEKKLREEAEAKAKAEAEGKAKAARDTAARMAAEAKAKAEKAKADAEAKAKAEAEAKARREEEERRRREEEARRAKEEAERKARDEAERKRREEEERRRQEEEARRAKEEAERKAREEAERKAREEAERKRREEEERRRQEEEARRAKEDAERRAREEEERKRREQEERSRQEEEARRAKEDAERKQREEAEEAERRRIEDERKRIEDERRRAEEEAARAAREEEERVRRAQEETKVRQPTLAAAPPPEPQPAPPPSTAPAPAAKDELPGSLDSLMADLDSFSQREEDERAEREAAERKARDEKKRQAKEESERRAREEAETERRQAEERRQRAEAERRAQEEAERRLREVEEQRLREADERRRKAREALSAAKQAQDAAAAAAPIPTITPASASTPRPASAAASEDDIGVTEADLSMDDVRRDQAKVAKESRKEQREREREARKREREARERAQAAARSAEAVKPSKPRRPTKWGKPVAVTLFLLLVAGVGALHLMPLPMEDYERAASTALGRPVRIGEGRLSLLTGVHLNLENVSIGNGVKVARVRAYPEIGSLFNQKKAFNRIEIEGMVLAQEALGETLFARAKGEDFSVRRIVVQRLKLDGPVPLPTVEADAILGPDGALRVATLRGPDDLNVKLTPDGGNVEFDATASSFTLPFLPETHLNSFAMKGVASRQEMTIASWGGSVLDGALSGTANVRWGSGWQVDGVITVRGINAAVFAPALLSEGKAEGTGKFTMSGADPAKLVNGTRIDGSFTVNKGVLGSFDLTRAIQTSGRQYAGRTQFVELTGQGVYDRGAVALRNVIISAGALNAGASADIEQSGALSGRIVADVKIASQSQRQTLSIGGTVREPQVRN